MTDLIALAVDEAAVAGLSIYHDDLSHMQAATSRFAVRMAQEVDERAPIPDVLPFQIVAAASLRHDLRTPLTAVLGHGELVAEEAREKGHAAMLTPMAEIVTASHRLLDSIDRLVEFSRVGLTDEAVTPRDHSVLSQARDVDRQLVESESRDRTGVIGRILIIDDNVNVLKPLVRRLSREGHQVVACESGEEAFDTISRHPFDVVLFDVIMPGLSGIEVLRKSKANLPDLPIIMISALDEMDTIVRCLGEGAEDYLSKAAQRHASEGPYRRFTRSKILARPREDGASEVAPRAKALRQTAPQPPSGRYCRAAASR
jgi:adenylate cyclase